MVANSSGVNPQISAHPLCLTQSGNWKQLLETQFTMPGVLKHTEDYCLGTKADIKLWALFLALCESAMGTPSQEA